MAEEEEGGPEAEAEAPGEKISEIEETIGEHSKYIADNFDRLFDEVQLLKKSLVATEKLLREEMDAKMKAMQDALMARIEMLEARAAEQSVRIAEQQSLSKQQAQQLQDLEKQVGVLFFRMH